MNESENGRMPEIGEHVRMKGTLVEIQDVTPPPPEQVLDYIFETTEARVEVLANGHILTEGATYNDFYGLDTCVKTAIPAATKMAADYGDGVEVRVIKVTSRIRMRPTHRDNFYAPEFRDFQSLDRGCRWDLPEPVEEVVWSSTETDR